MPSSNAPRLAILYPGDRAMRHRGDLAENRFRHLLPAFENADVAVEARLPALLKHGVRVLKQRHGHSGIGVWRVERLEANWLAVQHAQRGSVEERVDLDGVLRRLAPYFDNVGYLIDQACQPRMVQGMTHTYLVRDRVAGFGRQAVVALHPAVDGGAAPPLGTRLFSDSDDLRAGALPLLWDANFLLRDRVAGAAERHVLCEINPSSVSPFPESAIGPLGEATLCALA